MVEAKSWLTAVGSSTVNRVGTNCAIHLKLDLIGPRKPQKINAQALWQTNCNILIARVSQEDSMIAMGCRDWKKLAEAARDEQDPKKLMDLIQCLNRALDEHMKGLYPRSSEAAG